MEGETLPLENFNIQKEELNYIIRLLKSKNSMPVHIMLYGPPGTGKTALARHIAHELDRECFIQRASDLQDCFAGETEKKIAAAFRHAEEEGAVLVIDEADTFLYSRDMALHSWEVSFVNEFLVNHEFCNSLPDLFDLGGKFSFFGNQCAVFV